MAQVTEHLPYCVCKSPPGYKSLRDELNIFVCGECTRPSPLVYVGSHKHCPECGISFYSPWERFCSSCQAQILALESDGVDWAADWVAVNLGSRGYQSGDPDRDSSLPKIYEWRSWTSVRQRVLENPYCAYGI